MSQEHPTAMDKEVTQHFNKNKSPSNSPTNSDTEPRQKPVAETTAEIHPAAEPHPPPEPHPLAEPRPSAEEHHPKPKPHPPTEQPHPPTEQPHPLLKPHPPEAAAVPQRDGLTPPQLTLATPVEVNTTTDEYTTTDEPGHNEGVAKKPKTRDSGKGSRKKRGSHTGNTLDRESAALVYLPPEYRHKWTPGTQKLGTSKNLTAQHEEQISNTKLKSLRTELQLVPDVTDSDKQRRVKLVVKLLLGMNQTSCNLTHFAAVQVTLYDPFALSMLGRSRQESKFTSRGHLTLVMNLSDQEAAELSSSKHLLVIVNTEVCGYLPEDVYQWTEERDGFVMLQEKK